jgi:hypothetical protein
MKRVAYLVSVTLLFFTACGDQTESKRQGTDAVIEDSGQGSTAVAAAADVGNKQETERQETQRNIEDRSMN